MPKKSLKDDLAGRKLLAGVTLTTKVEALLLALQVTTPATDESPGKMTLGLSGAPLFLDLDLAPFDTEVDYIITKADGGFVVAVDLSTLHPTSDVLKLADAAAGLLTPATVHDEISEQFLTEATGTVELTGVAPQLRIIGKPGSAATVRLAPSPGEPADIVRLGLAPEAVLLGDSGFGIEFAGGLLIDDSTDAAPQGDAPLGPDGMPVTLPSATPAWRGIAVRDARFFLPGTVPLFGRTAVKTQLEIGLDPPGLSLSLYAKAPATPERGEITVRIDCLDPTATGLSSLAPTLVEATLEIPQEKLQAVATDAGAITLGAGKPLIARARFARDPTDPQKLTRVSLALEAQGDLGILHVDGSSGTAARALIAAAAFGTILEADGEAKQGGTITKLMVAAGALSTLLADGGSLTVHSAELASSGHGVPLDGPFTLAVDYSVDVVVSPLQLGILDIHLDPAQPLRIRMRGVVVSVDPAKLGLAKFDVDFKHAQMDIEDPGRWLVGGPDSLFDVLGTRSGRGSTWLEIDLRFKLNLGPIKVSGATVRATVDGSDIRVSLRGLDVSVSLPGLISGEGKLALTAPDVPGANPGFSAQLDAHLIPLGLGVDAYIAVMPPMILLRVGVDLPGPIPLGPTPLGLFGIGGFVGIAAAIKLPPDDGTGDIVRTRLAWQPDVTGFVSAPGELTLGMSAVVGTLADMGFSFSAKAALFLTVPDVAILGALDAQFMKGLKKLSDGPADGETQENGKTIAFRGVFSMSKEDGAAFALQGSLKIPVLLNAEIPVAGHFPPNSPDWFTYIGADGGVNIEDRGIGPAVVTVLPDILPSKADGYLMLRGQGITSWPRGQAGAITVDDGFVVAFGFSKEFFFGVKKIVWAEVSGGADIMVATNPLVIAGFGHINGSLHIGPASLGVSAQVTAYVSKDHSFVSARVCGRIKLLFIKIEKCATLSFGTMSNVTVPPPSMLPTDLVGPDAQGNPVRIGADVSVIDDHYRKLQELPGTLDGAPLVWPDALIRLGFATAPKVAANFAPQFADGINYPPAAQPIGSTYLKYEWQLDTLSLTDVTDAADTQNDGIAVEGTLSATWQKGKAGDADKLGQPAELVLLTPQGDLWLDRMADGGAGAPGDPLGQLATSCHATAEALPGWTLGANASSAGADWWLPPEMISTDPLQSRVEGRCWFGIDRPGVGFVLISALPSPAPFGFTYSGAYTYFTSFKFERPFPGGLRLPLATQLGELGPHLPTYDALIVLDDVLVREGRVSLLCSNQTLELIERLKPVTVRDAKGEWPLELKKVKNGVELRFAMPNGHQPAAINIRWQASFVVSLLGIGGITATAAKAAEQKQAKLDAAKAQNDAAANKPPAGSGADKGAAVRCLLTPGRSYRVDVAFRWAATLYEQDENGKPKVKETVADRTTYAPPGTDPAGDPKTMPDARARYFFKTAPDPHVAGTAAGPPDLPKYGEGNHLPTIQSKQDVFAPAMLERYLKGYQPAQSSVDVFRDDTLSVHFSVSHVAALADLYDYALEVAVRRVDIGGAKNALMLPPMILKHPTDPGFLKGRAAQHWIKARDSDCPVPVPGLTMEAPLQLEPRAWYEAYVRASYTGAANPKPVPAQIGGVTFRTSRWTDPADMLVGLGLPPDAATAYAGDLEVTLPTPIAPARSDSAFEAAMEALGLPGWPLALEPRLSLLWVQVASEWLLAGLLIESPEPIDRPGRCTIAAPEVTLSPVHPKVSFATLVADRTASRLLYLAGVPFKPASWSVPIKVQKNKPPIALIRHPELAVTLSNLAPKPGAPAVRGLLQLPETPQFAKEAF